MPLKSVDNEIADLTGGRLTMQAVSRPGILVVETIAVRLPFPSSVNIGGVLAVVNTAPTGAAIIVDVLKNGTTIWGTNVGNRPTIAAGAFTSGVAVPDSAALSAGDYLQVQVVQVGSTVAGADLVVTISYS